MESNYLNDLIIKKQAELAELMRVQAIVGEVDKLSVPTATVDIREGYCTIYFRATINKFQVNGPVSLDKIVNYLVEYFSYVDKVKLYISNYNVKGSAAELLGLKLETHKKFVLSNSNLKEN